MKNSQGPNKDRGKPMQERLSAAQAERATWLGWLVEFSQGTAEPRNAEEIRRLHEQFGSYLGDIFLHCDGVDHGGPHLLALGAPDTPDELPMCVSDNQKFLEEKIALVKVRVRQLVKKWFCPAGEQVRLEGRISLLRIVEGPHHEERRVAADVRDAIQFKLLEDLALVGSLLRQCPAHECPRFFVRHHRQEFCSSACRNRTNTKKWFEGHRKNGQERRLVRVKNRASKSDDTTSP